MPGFFGIIGESHLRRLSLAEQPPDDCCSRRRRGHCHGHPESMLSCGKMRPRNPPIPATVAALDKAPAQTAFYAKPPSEGPPTFDVVRVGPKGDTVIAGRAEPGSTVVILDNGKPIGKVVADGRGEWVFVPEKPLSAGNRKLSLKMILPGGDSIISDDMVVLVVPERDKDIAGRDTKKVSGALALKVTRRGGPSTLMQSPGGPTPKGLSIEILDYDDTGRLIITRRADAKARVNVYLDNVFIGRAMANGEGLWRLSPDNMFAPGPLHVARRSGRRKGQGHGANFDANFQGRTHHQCTTGTLCHCSTR